MLRSQQPQSLNSFLPRNSFSRDVRFGDFADPSAKTVADFNHPFGNDPIQHEGAISCITDIIDYALSFRLDPCDARIIIVGDFNDLRHYSNEIAGLTGTKALVDFPTCGVIHRGA